MIWAWIGVSFFIVVVFFCGVISGHLRERKLWVQDSAPGVNIHRTPDGGIYRVFPTSTRPSAEEIGAAQALKRSLDWKEPS